MRALASLLPSGGALLALALVGLVLSLGSLYLATQHTVWVEINGMRVRHRTHARTVSQVLREMRISLLPEDRVLAPPEEELERGTPLQVDVARVAVLLHDGSVTLVRTHATDVADVVRDSGVVVFPHDRLLLMGQPSARDQLLPAPASPQSTGVQSWLRAIRRPIQITVRRAVSLQVQDGPVAFAFFTTARTVGEALHERGLVVYAGDRVNPPPSSEIAPGLNVFIERSKPVVLAADGTRRALRTRSRNVAELLSAEGVSLGPKDYVLPDPRTAVGRDVEVSVVRVYDEYYAEEVPIAFQTRWEPDPTMEIDESQVTRWGREGARRRRLRAHYENGRELFRTEEEDWVARMPLDRIINFGTKIVLRSVETPSGALVYWRKVRMLATSYNAPTAGVSRSNPWYGRTRLGRQAAKGIVAVDPRVINLGQTVYVSGYGVAVAADTGGAIKGRRIDLCFNEDDLELWYHWVDVYLLAPAPPSEQVAWIIPNSPRQRE
jgi:uncharacterized protein YabE (DUF348 family)